MLTIKNNLLSLLLISFLCYSSNVASQTTLIKNVQGYTLENNQLKQFNALLFTNNKIDKIFNLNEPLPTSKNIRIIDGKGKTLLPGLIDAHGHVLSYGLSLLQVDLVNVASEAKAVVRAKRYAEKNNGLTWIKGRGWNQVQWPTNKFPTAKSLDKYFPNQAVWLKRIDGHAGWANSKAMALAGISKTTATPLGGEIIKDNQGNPSGIFIDNAMALIDDVIPPLTYQENKIALEKAMKSLVSLGLTSVHDAGIDKENIRLFEELNLEGALPLRINAMLYLPSNDWRNILKQGPKTSQNEMFSFNSVKIQLDGALGSRGAALIEDYSDQIHQKGLLLHSAEDFSLYVETAMKAGFQVNTHAIGDNANKLVLDEYQQSITQTKSKKLRHRIEHAQILQLSDIPRFSQLGIIASMQATHATSDKNMAQKRLGEQRILGAYAWRKLLKAKATIAAGSDFPVESANPFFGLHAAITRQDHNNQPKGGWFAEEKMTRIEAFKSFTIDAAYSGHHEKIIGSLLPGKKADFILVEQNLFTMPESEIWQSLVLETWVNGKMVYKK
jgi:predicted amidohydrolase YtcJ